MKKRVEFFKSHKANSDIQTLVLLAAKIRPGDIVVYTQKCFFVDSIRYSKKYKSFYFYCYDMANVTIYGSFAKQTIKIADHRNIRILSIEP